MGNLLAASMPLIVDVVGIVFILIFAIKGMREGFGQIFFATFGTIICLVLSVLLCSSVANFLQAQFGLATMVSEKLQGSLSGVFGEEVLSATLEGVSAEMLKELNVNVFLQKIILSVAESSTLPLETTLADVIFPTLAFYAVMICSAILLFIILKIIIKLLSAGAERLRSVVAVAALDEFLGFVLGLIGGIIYLELIIMLMNVIPLEAVQNVCNAIAETSVIGKVHGVVQSILGALSSGAIGEFLKGIAG